MSLLVIHTPIEALASGFGNWQEWGLNGFDETPAVNTLKAHSYIDNTLESLPFSLVEKKCSFCSYSIAQLKPFSISRNSLFNK
jgi:hypothetical protein